MNIDSSDRKKILSISASYPPYHSGGYEIRIKNILDGLSDRGYEIKVLTTIPEKINRSKNTIEKYPINRKLHDRRKAKFFPKEVWFDLLDTGLIEREIKQFKPDLLYLGHIYNLSKAILPFLAGLQTPVVFDEGGNVLKGAWTEHGRWFRFTGNYNSHFWLLRKIKPSVVDLVCKLSKGRIKKDWSWPQQMKIIFNSYRNQSFVASIGVPVHNSVVIHSGVDLKKFTFKIRNALNSPIRIIIPGRIEEGKGQIDGIRLLKLMRKQGIKAELTIIGAIGDRAYYQKLINEISSEKLLDVIKILSMHDHLELIRLYHQAEICFFPSYQEAGFSRIPLEAMACGCLLISYGKEGSDEIICNGRNGFLINAGDLNQIRNLLHNLTNQKFREIIGCARELIENEYDLNNYIKRIEKNIIDQVY